MFEKATIFSSIFIFTVFGIVGIKYYQFLDAKNQVTQTSISNEQLTSNNLD